MLLGSTVTGDALKSFTSVLWVISGIGFVCAGVAIVLVTRAPGWWRPIAMGAALIGMASFVVFWDGQTAEFVNQGGIGFMLSTAVFLGAVAIPDALGLAARPRGMAPALDAKAWPGRPT